MSIRTGYHEILGRVAWICRNWDKAAEHFRAAHEFGGRDALQKRHAQAALKAGMYDRALVIFRNLANEYPDDPEIHLGLGIARTHKGWSRAALESFSRHAELNQNGIAANVLKSVGAEISKDSALRQAQGNPTKGNSNAPVSAVWEKNVARNIRRTRKVQSQIQKERGFFRDALAALTSSQLPARRLTSIILEIQKTDNPLAMALAQSLAERNHMRERGLEALIHLHERRNLHRFVLDLAKSLPEHRQLETCFTPIVAARSSLAGGDATDFVERWLDHNPDGTTDLEIVAALDATLAERSEDTVRRILERFSKTPGDIADDDPVRPTALRADCWLQRREGRPRGAGRRLGLLSYHAPVKPSTNIGDYIQTIAAAGLIACTLGDEVRYGGPAGRWINRCVSAGRPRDDASDLEVVFYDRDDRSTAADEGETFVLINGWFMHKEGTGKHNFPFAPTIRPLFLAIHIARPEFLDDEAISYLRCHAPVGARDRFTFELLRANGIPSFFNGCPTLTLDLAIGRHDGPRQGRYYAAHRVPPPNRSADSKIIYRLHTEPSVGWRTDNDLMELAWSFLADYATAEHVETPLLHCQLPCHALNTPSTFTHPRLNSDTRFEGVIGISDTERDALKQNMLDRIAGPLRAIATGASADEVYRLWREAVAPEVDPIETTAPERAAAASVDNRRLPEPVILSKGHATKSYDLPVCHIAMAFDANLCAEARVTLRSLVAHATGPMHLIALVREVDREMVEPIVTDFPAVRVTIFEMDAVVFKDLQLLLHTTPSTIDRLLLPLLLPNISRCVYIDVDIAICGDIRQLFNVDLGDAAIGARQTQYQGWDSGFSLARLIDRQLKDYELKTEFRNRFILKESLNYRTFNAGVMVMDLEKLRAANFTDWTIEVVSRFGINDQFAANLFAAGDFHEIGRQWNHFPTQEIVEDAKIIHYIGRPKPWNIACPPAGETWRSYMSAEERETILRPDNAGPRFPGRA